MPERFHFAQQSMKVRANQLWRVVWHLMGFGTLWVTRTAAMDIDQFGDAISKGVWNHITNFANIHVGTLSMVWNHQKLPISDQSYITFECLKKSLLETVWGSPAVSHQRFYKQKGSPDQVIARQGRPKNRFVGPLESWNRSPKTCLWDRLAPWPSPKAPRERFWKNMNK